MLWTRPARVRKLQRIAEQLNWTFYRERYISNDLLPGYKRIHVLYKELEGGVQAYIFDAKAKLSGESGHRYQEEGLALNTFLLLEFPTQIVSFYLRPKTWADDMGYRGVMGKKFVIKHEEPNVLRRLFDAEAMAHYDEAEDLRVIGVGHTILLQYNQAGYLPASKERYLDFMAEGKYIAHLMQRYLEWKRHL